MFIPIIKKKRDKNFTNLAAFSLVELVIYLAIVGILMAVAVPGYFVYINWAYTRSAQGTLNTLKLNINRFNADTGRYPQTLNDLVRKPTDSKVAAKWQGPYLEGDEVPSDPWDHEFAYKPTPGKQYPYELYSWGPKGPGSEPSEWISAFGKLKGTAE